MKKIYLLFACFCINQVGFSQENIGLQDKMSLSPCGTHAGLHEKEIVIDHGRNGGDTVLYVPLTLHQMANDAGSFFSTGKVLDAFDQLNKNYADSKIHWFMEGDIRFVKNTAWNGHKTIPEGANMMFANNVKNTINCYVCTNAAGNCGYNLPYAGVALARSCMGASDHTWAHELGHALRLPHPFLGWEAKTYNPNAATPSKVTYDYSLFKDSLILNQTIIDTALVEFVNGSNCAKAADQICDTKPDYISTRWACDANKMSPLTYKDPNGESFKVDGTLYMSYSLDACQNRFSADEIGVMRTTLKTKKKNLLYNQVPKPALTLVATTLFSPLDLATIDMNSAVFNWDKVSNATHYLLEISRLQNFSTLDQEYILTKTSHTVTTLSANKTYYWRVRAFNSHYTGAPYTPKLTFKTGNFTAVNTLSQVETLVLSPNPTSNKLQVDFSNNDFLSGEITLSDFTGKKLLSQTLILEKGVQQMTFDLSTFAKGMYFFSLTDKKGGVLTRKIVKL